MWPDRVSNSGPPTYELGALPIALRGPAMTLLRFSFHMTYVLVGCETRVHSLTHSLRQHHLYEQLAESIPSF